MNQIQARRVFRMTLFPVHRDPLTGGGFEEIPRREIPMTEAGAQSEDGGHLGGNDRGGTCDFPGWELGQRSRGFFQKPVLQNLKTIVEGGVSRFRLKPPRPKGAPLAARPPSQTIRRVPSDCGGHRQQSLLAAQPILLIWIRDELSHAPSIAFPQKKDGPRNGMVRIPQQNPGTGNGWTGRS